MKSKATEKDKDYVEYGECIIESLREKKVKINHTIEMIEELIYDKK